MVCLITLFPVHDLVSFWRVRPDSPSKGDTNWLFTRPSQLVDKRWQLDCVSTVSPGAHLPNTKVQHDVFRERVARERRVIILL